MNITILDVQDWEAHIFPILTKRRDELQNHLFKKEVQTLIHYPIPPHKQAYYMQYNYLSFSVAESPHYEELSLPISPLLKMEEAEIIAKAINSFK